MKEKTTKVPNVLRLAKQEALRAYNSAKTWSKSPWDKAWDKGPWDKGHWANRQ